MCKPAQIGAHYLVAGGADHNSSIKKAFSWTLRFISALHGQSLPSILAPPPPLAYECVDQHKLGQIATWPYLVVCLLGDPRTPF